MRLLSGQGKVPLFGARGETISGEGVRADHGQNGYLCGNTADGVSGFGKWQERRKQCADSEADIEGKETPEELIGNLRGSLSRAEKNGNDWRLPPCSMNCCKYAGRAMENR